MRPVHTVVLPLLIVAVVVILVATLMNSPECAALPGTRAEIDATPRADQHIEQLAVRLSHAIVANQKIYDRLASDLRAIRRSIPALEAVTYHPTDDGNTLIVRLTLLGRALQAVGLYKCWDCLNTHYRLKQIGSVGDSMLLHFDGTYNMNELAQLYGKLPGIRSAEPNALVNAGDRRTLCVTEVGQHWHYVLLQQNRRRHLYYFISTASGETSASGEWELPESAGEFERSSPSWVTQYWSADACA